MDRPGNVESMLFCSLRTCLLGIIFLLSFSHQSSAQHADLGTGVLKNEIWWLDWAGITLSNGATRTFTTNDGLTIQVVFSNVSPHVPLPSVMNDYFGAVLHLLYDFSDPAIQPALFDFNSSINFNYTMTVTASRDGLPVSFYFLTADAEASQTGETTTIQTNGGNWQTIQFFRNSPQTNDPLTGCNTQTASIINTYWAAAVGQNPVIATLSPSAGPLVVNANFDHAGTTGGMALAFGILQSEDRGDLPASYGTAQHQILYTISNPCNFNPPYPSLDQATTLMIGSVPGDADPIQYADDNAIGVDEEGVSSFPQYNNSGTYSVNVVVGNTTGADAFLTGWFDYNRNGVFDPGEFTTVTIPNNATSTVLTWTGLPAYLPPGTAGGYGFRFRLSSDLAATQNATGFARDGEVEDYFVTPETLCSPVHVIASGLPACLGQPANLHASGGASYTWSPSTGLSDPTSPDPVASVAATSSYTVTALDPQGCSGSDNVTVVINQLPTVTISNDTTVCQGHPANLMASGGVTYAWTASDNSINVAGPVITPSPVNSTKYYVLVSDANGCSSLDSVDVMAHHVSAFSVKPDKPVICMNDSVQLIASGGNKYAWISPGGLVLGQDSSIFINPVANGSYQVQVTDIICHQTGTLTVPVVVNPLPAIGVTKSNDLDCSHGQATLEASGAISYQWANIPGISDLTISDPVVRPSLTTTYYVQGTDRNGCSSIDSVTVLADFASDPSHYPVSSAFSPNNDGNNDCFGLKNWGRVTSLEFSVFNRWGQRVFFTTDPQQCWDGTYKGAPQPAGGYAYQIRAVTVCGTAYRKGIVLLIR